MKSALAALLLLMASPAWAVTNEEIFAVYARGDYEQAARLGEASHTAPGLATHCHRYTDESPRWQIGRETLQSTMAVYMRDLEPAGAFWPPPR